MRVVGGRLRGRNLASPATREIRPTADRLRESVFNILMHAYDDPIEGARVLDLFAGTGALGLEAMSRGARSCDFVETRPASLHALKANVVALRMRERTRIFKRDALPFAAALRPDAYDLAFLDPPYGSRMLDRVLDIVRSGASVDVARAAVTDEMRKATDLAMRLPDGPARHALIQLARFLASRCGAVAA